MAAKAPAKTLPPGTRSKSIYSLDQSGPDEQPAFQLVPRWNAVDRAGLLGPGKGDYLMSPERKPQVRLRYSKLGKVRFTSHRDMARIWERSVRKVNLPIAYSEGFSPRAKLSFGLALPTVFESEAEYVDLTFKEPVDVEAMVTALSDAAPDGIVVLDAIELHGKVDSLQECVEATVWSLFVDGDVDALTTWSNDVLNADELLVTRERKGKSRTDDVRAAILEISVHSAEGANVPGATAEIRAELAAKPRALRPLELLGINTPPCTFVLGRRVHQFITPVGARHDPLVVGAAQASHDVSCAS